MSRRTGIALSFSVYLDLHDLWMGCYWKREDAGAKMMLYLCPLPCVVLRVKCWRWREP